MVWTKWGVCHLLLSLERERLFGPRCRIHTHLKPLVHRCVRYNHEKTSSSPTEQVTMRVFVRAAPLSGRRRYLVDFAKANSEVAESNKRVKGIMTCIHRSNQNEDTTYTLFYVLYWEE